uniref:Uncharacterized protein n=1 Tax=Rhabditophanes sp. KR3021 TaxID=114890 RepID=A0AC35TMC6_9BILA
MDKRQKEVESGKASQKMFLPTNIPNFDFDKPFIVSLQRREEKKAPIKPSNLKKKTPLPTKKASDTHDDVVKKVRFEIDRFTLNNAKTSAERLESRVAMAVKLGAKVKKPKSKKNLNKKVKKF